jgi:hypothetical protein
MDAVLNRSLRLNKSNTFNPRGPNQPVPDPLPLHLPLKLSQGQQDIQRQPAHFCVLLVFCWPSALLALILYPSVCGRGGFRVENGEMSRVVLLRPVMPLCASAGRA